MSRIFDSSYSILHTVSVALTVRESGPLLKSGNMYYVERSSGGPSRSVNNYVPNRYETPLFENKCDNISLKRRAIRILSRRYALTTTEFKFLEIGINVGTPSYVEIVIGDHQGKELVLSLETWKGLYEQRRNIHDLLRKDSKDTYNFISVGPLTVRVHTINDTKLISLESLNVRMMMIEPTLHRMFNLDQCIDVTFDRLVRITETVDTKFTQFSNIASTITDNKKVSNVICASDAFNKHQLVDCELVALVFSHNM
ncbi:uncharacterized protein [Anoplolepis gracilipes]|uniref:uncharacterized protein n=1 Tax=Anoplolepis gracilipes TaxID=354296 RepID=UPI003BA0C2D1